MGERLMFESLCSPTTSKCNIHHIHHASQQNSFFLWNRHVACHRKLVASFVICGGSFLSGCLAGEGKMIDSLMAVNQVERLGSKLPSASKWTSHKSRHRLEDQKYTRQNQMLMCKIIRIMQQQPGKVREYTRALQAFVCQILPVIPFLLRDPVNFYSFPAKSRHGRLIELMAKRYGRIQIKFQTCLRSKSLSIWEPALIWDSGTTTQNEESPLQTPLQPWVR